MSLVPYSSIETNVDMTNTNTRFYQFKLKIVKDSLSFIEEDVSEAISYVEKIRQGVITDQKEISDFINSELLDLIKLILARTYRFSSDFRNQAKLQIFVFQIMLFAFENLDPKYPGALEIITQMLNIDNPYYKFNTYYSNKDIVEELYKKYPFTIHICPLAKYVYDDGSVYPLNVGKEEESALGGKSLDDPSLQVKVVKCLKYPGKNLAKESCVHQKVSIVYLINMNLFLQIDGPDIIFDYLFTTKSVSSILQAIELFTSIQNYIDYDHYKERIIPRIGSLIRELTSNFTETDIKSAKKEDISKLISLVQNSIKGHFDKTELSEFLVTYELDILLLCLKSQSMDKRIYAITGIVEKISVSERNESSAGGNVGFYPPKPSIFSSDKKENNNSGLTTEVFIQWLENNEIINILLGESSHIELLRRSSPLFRFLFRNGRLSLEKIDSIFSLALEKHDTLRKHILKILSDIAELMSHSEHSHLFERIKEMNPQEIDQDMLQLIKTIGNNIYLVNRAKTPKKNNNNNNNNNNNSVIGGIDTATAPADVDFINDNSTKIEQESIYDLIDEKEFQKKQQQMTQTFEERIENDSEDLEKNKKRKKDLVLDIEEKQEETIDDKSFTLGRNLLEFLWNILINKNMSSQVANYAGSIIKEMLGGKLGIQRMHIIEKAIDAIAKNQVVSEAIEILQHILKSQYPIKRGTTDIKGKRELILMLDSEYSLTHILFGSLIQLKADTLALVDSNSEPENGSQITLESESDQIVRENLDERIVPEQTEKKAANALLQHNEIINNYLKDLENRLKFIRFLKSNSYERLEFKHANLVWKLLHENAINDREREVLFSSFTSIIYAAQNEFNILDEDVINFVFSDILLNIKFSFYTPMIYNCFEAFFMYLNKRYELIKQESGHNIKVMSLDLIGIESLWELYLNAIDPKVTQKTQDFLLKLATHLNDKNSRPYFVEMALKHIEKAYSNIKDNINANEEVQRISCCIDFIIKLLEEFGELHSTKNHGKGEPITVSIFNTISGAMHPKKFPLVLFSSMTLSDAKSFIGSKLNPSQAGNEIMIMTKGSVLLHDKMTLEELKITNELTLHIMKNSTVEDTEMTAIPLMGPVNQIDENTADFREKLSNLTMFVGDVDEETIKFVLKKKNGDVEEAANILLDPSLLESFRRTMEEEEKKAPAVISKSQSAPKEGEIRLNQLISNNQDYFDLLFKILALEIPELDGKVWNLLMNLPMNCQIYDSIKKVFSGEMDLIKDEIVVQDVDWSSKLDAKNSPKLLYSLQIIKNIISCQILDEKDPDVFEKAEWRINFLEKAGVSYLFNLFLAFPSEGLVKQINSANRSHNTEAKLFNVILNILKVYSHASILASASDARAKMISEILGFNTNEKKQDKDSASQQPSQPPSGPESIPGPVSDGSFVSAHTPTFVSPDASNSTTPRSQTPNITKEKDPDEFSLAGFKGGKEIAGQVDEFKEFIKAVHEKNKALAIKIFENFDYERFITRAIEVIQVSLELVDKDNDLTQVVSNCIDFVAPCLVAYPNLLNSLYDHPSMPHIIKTAFLICQESKVRAPLTHLITYLSRNSHSILALKHDIEGPEFFFLKNLLPLIFTVKIEDNFSDDYFLTLSDLMKMVPKTTILDVVDIVELYVFIIRYIKERPIFEERSSDSGDKVLCGFLLLAHTLLEIEPDLRNLFDTDHQAIAKYDLTGYELIKELYDYLFYLPKEEDKINPTLNLPKCKYKTTRSNAFRFLYLLCQGNETHLYKMINLLALNHQKLPNFNFDYNAHQSSASIDLKNVNGYVGLKNLGCTCYMNSLIQQIYMTIPLRNTILHSEITIKLSEEKEVFLSQLTKEQWEIYGDTINTQLQDNLLYQLQLLLAGLEESVSQYLHPTDFFASIKTINGEKIVTGVQHDVNEFFNNLTDKLDNNLKGTPQSVALNELIGGNVSNEIISLEKDYPYYNETQESYLTIPLDIKNKRDLTEALDAFIKEDILEGDNKYHCEKYDRKIRVMKRCCIKTLPNTFIITLKRFDFDYNTMQRVKINDYFEFPTSINLKPWTKAGLKDQIPPEANYEPPNLDDSYYEYELVGVLVHSGTAEGGHYYSYIKDRKDPKKGWYEFNDQRTLPFNIKNLKNECFGGGSSDNSSKDLFDFDFTKSRNAYILFYERPKAETTKYSVYQDAGVPQKLSDQIWRQNLEILRSRYFYDVDYFKFVMESMKLFQFPEYGKVGIGYSEVSDIAARRAETARINELLKSIEDVAVKEEKEFATENQIETEICTEDTEEKWRKELHVIKLIFILACEIYMKTKEGDQFSNWMKMLQEILDKFAPAVIWFIKYINENNDIMKLLYVDGVSLAARDSVKDLLNISIERCATIEADYFNDVEELKRMDQNTVVYDHIPKSALHRFLEIFCHHHLEEKVKDLSKPVEYIKLINSMIPMSPLIPHFMARKGILDKFWEQFIYIQKLLNNSFPLTLGTSIKEKEKYHHGNVILYIQFLELMVRSCITEAMYQAKTVAPTYLFGKDVDFRKTPRIDEKIVEAMIEHENFKKHLMSLQEKNDSFLKIAQHIAWENKDSSKKMISSIVSNCCSIVCSIRQMDEGCKVLYHFAKLEDKYQNFRIEFMFSDQATKNYACSRGDDLLAAMKKVKDGFDKAHSVLGIRWIAQMTEIHLIRIYMLENPARFEWMVPFVEEHMESKHSIYLITESELNSKIPIFLKKSFELLSPFFPHMVKKKEKPVIEKIEEELDGATAQAETDTDLKNHDLNSEENFQRSENPLTTPLPPEDVVQSNRKVYQSDDVVVSDEYNI